MNELVAFLLGIIQSITEFLPISSSGHLAVFGHLLKLQVSSPLFFYICLHIGTLISVLIFFRKQIFDILTLKNKKLLITLIVAILSTGPLAIVLENMVKTSLNTPRFVALMWIVNGAILLSLFARYKESKKDVGIVEAVIIGLLQGISVLPGISRSGITIASALHLGIEKNKAFEFSFLLFIPAVIGSCLFESGKRGFMGQEFHIYFTGFLTALVGSLFSLWILKKVINKGWFPYFGFYSLFIGSMVLFF